MQTRSRHLASTLSATPAEAWDQLKSLQRIYLGTRWLRPYLENKEQGLRRSQGELGREGAQLSRQHTVGKSPGKARNSLRRVGAMEGVQPAQAHDFMYPGQGTKIAQSPEPQMCHQVD